MRPSVYLHTALLLQFGGFTSAHSGNEIPVPRMFGGSAAIRHLPRHLIQELQGREETQSHHVSESQLQKRDWTQPGQEVKKECGPGIGYCKEGECCSPVGYCGRTTAHCASPNCQIDYSSGCDGTRKPLGESLLNLSRPLIGNVTYGGDGIDHCSVKGKVALTFDDGPYNFTNHVLDVLATYKAKATFFITGNNIGKGQIDIEENGWPAVLRRMHADGHQIALHSMGHYNHSSLNETQLINQIHYVEMAVRNVLGFIPTYYRPPYDDCTTDLCKNTLRKMGYHITYQNQVNNDWKEDDGDEIEASKDLFVKSMRWTNPRDVNYIFLQHDTHFQTAYNLTNYMLDYFEMLNFTTSVTVGECMGDPPENWYRAAGGAANHSLLLKNAKSHGNALQYSMWSMLLVVGGQLFANLFL
ncbi:glycoside hydrolase/deacetylase [Phaeosphaeriaceae sp. SRC1lsM3a]|nr:glycoside hydrolase/deacetylase [Stagonospora sp. SRC1lsM3a]